MGANKIKVPTKQTSSGHLRSCFKLSVRYFHKIAKHLQIFLCVKSFKSQLGSGSRKENEYLWQWWKNFVYILSNSIFFISVSCLNKHQNILVINKKKFSWNLPIFPSSSNDYFLLRFDVKVNKQDDLNGKPFFVWRIFLLIGISWPCGGLEVIWKLDKNQSSHIRAVVENWNAERKSFRCWNSKNVERYIMVKFISQFKNLKYFSQLQKSAIITNLFASLMRQKVFQLYLNFCGMRSKKSFWVIIPNRKRFHLSSVTV